MALKLKTFLIAVDQNFLSENLDYKTIIKNENKSFLDLLALFKLKRKGKTSLPVEKTTGRNLLMLMLAYLPRTSIIETIVLAAPDMVRETCKKDWYPLHYAMYYGVSEGIVRILMRVFPAAALKRCNTGQIPFFFALQNSNFSLGPAKAILAMSPNILLEKMSSSNDETSEKADPESDEEDDENSEDEEDGKNVKGDDGKEDDEKKGDDKNEESEEEDKDDEDGKDSDENNDTADGEGLYPIEYLLQNGAPSEFLDVIRENFRFAVECKLLSKAVSNGNAGNITAGNDDDDDDEGKNPEEEEEIPDEEAEKENDEEGKQNDDEEENNEEEKKDES